MTKDFDKLENNVLKNTTSYKYICLICAVIFAIETISAFYVAFIGNYPNELGHLHRAIFYAFFVNFGLSCLVYKIIGMIDKFKDLYKTEQPQQRD